MQLRHAASSDRRSGPLSLTVLATALLGLAVTSSKAQEPAQFRAEIDIARIEVSVAGEDGGFPLDLSVDDFTLLVDGVPRELVAVYPIDAREETAPEAIDREALVSGAAVTELASTRPPVARRHFLIYIDLSTMGRTDLRNARSSAIRFLEDRAAPADMIGLAVYSPLSGLHYHVPFTTDHELSLAALGAVTMGRASESIDPVGDGIPLDELVDALSNEVTDAEEFLRQMERTRVESQSENSLDALAELGGTLNAIEGRKHLLYFSRGFSDRLLEDPGARRTLMASTDAAALSNVAIHTFLPSSLPTSNVHDLREIEPTSSRTTFEGPITRPRITTNRAVLGYLAAETGGTSWYFRHAVNKGLEEVEMATRRFYVLAFQALSSDPDEVDLTVVVRRSGLDLTWAPTRFRFPSRASSWTAAQRQFRVAEALQIGTEINDLEMGLLASEVAAPEGAARLGIVATVPPGEMGRLLEERGDGGLDLEVLGLALTPWSTVSDYFRTRLTVPVGTVDVAGDLEPFRYYNQLQVPRGRYFVKVLFRETSTGLMTSRTLTFDTSIGESDALRVSAPLFVVPPDRARLTRGMDSTERPEHRAEHDMSYPFSVNGRDLVPISPEGVVAGHAGWLYLRADSIGTDGSSGTANVAASMLLLTPDGMPRNLAVDELVAAELEPGGKSMRLLLHYRLPDDLPAGEYTLAINVRDHVARLRRQVEATLSVVSSSPSG